jgi:N-carbamoylputrescine amidase
MKMGVWIDFLKQQEDPRLFSARMISSRPVAVNGTRRHSDFRLPGAGHRHAIILPPMAPQNVEKNQHDPPVASPQKVSLGLVQMHCGEDPQENVQHSIDHIRKAAARGARVICLQELFRSPYFCQEENTRFFDLAESIPGPTTKQLGQIAQELQVVIVASLFEKRTSGLYHNCAVVIDVHGQVTGKYRKMHIPDDPYYYEKFYFTPGDLGFQSHPTPYGELGVLVCWDQWFPEAARLTALKGAQLILYPTAIGWLEGSSEEENQAQQSAWETVQRGHAITNGVFLAAVNRVGREGKLNFWGQSFVCDPFGRVLAKASAEEEEILVVECDLAQIEETRRNWPFWRDRRIDAYQGLNLRFLDEVPDSE